MSTARTPVNQSPSIFRSEALRHRLHHQGRRSAELRLPRPLSRRVRVVLWAALGLLGLAGAGVCLPSVPVSASGLVVVAPGDARPAAAVVLPLEYRGRLRPGQAAEVSFGAGGASLAGTVVAVEPEPLWPADVQRRLGLPGSALVLDGPVVVAWLSVPSLSDHRTTAPGVGGVARADVDVGSRRAGSFLPLVGRLFEE